MSKGMNQKKQEKKKPAKNLDEKRAAKKEKKQERASRQMIQRAIENHIFILLIAPRMVHVKSASDIRVIVSANQTT